MTPKEKVFVIGVFVLAAIVIIVALVAAPSAPGPDTDRGGTEAGGSAEAFTPFVPRDSELIERNNTGVGLMGQFKYDEARAVFTELAEAHPNWLDVQANLAIATLNRQESGDEQRALDILTDVLERDPTHLRAHYISGLLKLYLESPEQAAEHFIYVAENDPDDAYAAYYVGQCFFQARNYEQALPWYEKALELDKFLRSAYYALGQTCQRVGRRERAGELLQEFQRLDNNPRARLIEFVYTRMGPKGEAKAIDLPRSAPPPFPEGEIFADAAPLLAGAGSFTWNDAPRDRPASITAVDLNDDGNLDLFIADALRHGTDVNNAVVINNGDGTYALETDHILATVSAVNAVLWGDYDNDGLTDVYLCRRGGNQLWRQIESGVWRDVTAEAGAGNESYDTVDGAVFDADHDGDLDVFCINADGPNELLNNNLDGTFRPIAQSQGIAGSGGASRQVVATDLDRDRDADIIVINDAPPHEVYINDRGWSYRDGADEGFDGFQFAEIRAAIAADLDADGLVELYTLNGAGAVTRWKGDRGIAWSGHSLHPADQVNVPTTHQIAVADVNGNGQVDVLSSSGFTWHVVNYQVKPGFRRPFEPDDGTALQGWAVVNLDCGSGPSVVGVASTGEPMVWSPGPGRFGYVGIELTGMEDQGKSMRSNASGIGVFLQARIDSTWTARDTFAGSSGPGRSLQPLALGTAGHSFIDFIRLDWPDGVLQTELHDVAYLNDDQVRRTRDFSPGSCETIEQIQRLTSSCPVLFAWDGEKYAFVSDVLGVGGIGYMVAPGEYAPPRPWENLLLPDGLLVPRSGRYAIKFGEPMQEAAYLDSARLVAWDLPPGWSMTLDERMSILGPGPTGEPRFYRDSMVPVRAVNDRGENVTIAVINVDHQAAAVGALDTRFIGRLQQDHVLTLTFDRPIGSSPGAMLIADGWIEYPYSQTMFAAWQAGADYRAPTVEARGADGQWHAVLEQFGYPAGMPRQMSVPLKGLPEGTRELRITTNQEIYWDRLMIAWAEECPDAKRAELPLMEASMRRTGFARHTVSGQQVPHYDYRNRSPFWDTRAQSGAYTAFGRIDELVAAADDALAIIGPGEEVHLEFAAQGTGPARGWFRRFVLESVGWCKDMDLYTKDGLTVGPLPSRNPDSAARDALHAKYNTRLVAGE